VRWLGSPELHAKAIVMDRQVAYLGSVNLTYSSMDRNREVGLVTDDAAAVERIARTIEGDLANGRAEF
jgi:phosphatidylserine/phosphatidylglycerophosphate/cardiolipin synthase-like enzyme